MKEIDSPDMLLEYLSREKGYYENDKANHVGFVLMYVREIQKELEVENRNTLIQYVAVLHDIGKTKRVKKEYEGNHEERGCHYLLEDKEGEEILKACRMVKYKEIIARYVLHHKEVDERDVNSLIVFAADKLAHYKSNSSRCDESLTAIEKISNKDVKECAIEIAKGIALGHERERSAKKVISCLGLIDTVI